MAHKKNGKSKANQTTTWQQKNDANNVSATVKLAGKAEVVAAEVPENSRNHAAWESYNSAATGNNRRIASTYS